ncbi:MAG TPA: hypothetical protein VFX15_03235 [Actinomycetes bacterium]|nr:hypothetical protein [Actinomycetes bacterium]
MNWTLVPNAVSELLELIDDENEERFRLQSIRIEPYEPGILRVVATDADGYLFRYALYVTRSGIVADGY